MKRGFLGIDGLHAVRRAIIGVKIPPWQPAKRREKQRRKEEADKEDTSDATKPTV
jgi:hypothetical protein